MKKQQIINVFLFVLSIIFLLINIITFKSVGQAKYIKVINYLSILISFFLFIICFIKSNIINYDVSENPKTVNYIKLIPFFVFTSSIILLFCSECSLLYPLNLWDDSNCFFTVGKSVLSGKVLYRDLFEQKGPYLYFLHTFAAMLSYTSFHGVYIIEIFFSTILLLFIYKTLILFTTEKIVYCLPLLLAVFYSSNNFQLGDSAEEFCLPLLIIPFYYSIKNFKSFDFFSPKELIITGICAGFVFLIKFSMVGFFVGFAIMPVIWYIKEKKYKDIFLAVLYIFIGLVISFIPLIIYCFFTHSFKDFFEVYIYNNIFIYSDEDIIQENYVRKIIALISNCIISLFYHLRNNYLIFLLGALSIIQVFKSSKFMAKTNYLTMLFFTVVFIFGPGRNFRYYSLILDIFFIFSVIPVYNSISNIKNINKKLIYSTFGLAALFISIFMPFHKKVRFIKKENLPQYKFAKIINQTPNATLLNYGSLDDGFYITSRTVPTTRYFCLLTIPIKEMHDEQKDIVVNGRVYYVVSREKIDFANKYELVSEEQSLRPTWEDTTFYLYKLIDN